MNKVICIVGPTGIGKTKLSIELAKYLDTEIINGDLIQMYQKVDILSAKPSLEEQAGIKHHLLDYLALDQSYDIAQFKVDANKLIEELNKQNKIPIIVGGSGLYIKALLYDYRFDQFEQRDTKNNNKYDNYNNEELFEVLKTLDYEASQILHPNNRRRVLRAIEISEGNELNKSELLAQQKKEMVYDALVIGLQTERDKLYERINLRVDLMLKAGLLKEVETLYNNYRNTESQAFVAIGYKELIPYLNNEMDLVDCIDKIKQNSRRYAKKQLTWFNNQMQINWIESNLDDFNQTIKQAKLLVEEFTNEQ